MATVSTKEDKMLLLSLCILLLVLGYGALLPILVSQSSVWEDGCFANFAFV